jgi:hypothetical protein
MKWVPLLYSLVSLRALKKSAELSDYTDFDMITQIFQCNFICVIDIESL